MDVQIVVVPQLAYNSPAAIDRVNAVLYLNDSVLPGYSQKEIEFIILHELGHYYQQTDDELLSDQYAIDEMLKTHPNLKDGISALSKALPANHVRIANIIGEDFSNHKANGRLREMNEIKRGNLNYFDGLGTPSAGELMTNPNQPGKVNYFYAAAIMATAAITTSIIGSVKAKKERKAIAKQDEANRVFALEQARLNNAAILSQTDAAMDAAKNNLLRTKTMVVTISISVVVLVVSFFVFRFIKNKHK